jgi:hypothetical protein
MTLSIEAYAQVMAELASAAEGVDARAATLARHGLDEAGWTAVDDHWQDALSAALDPDDDEIPAILESYASAYQAAQRALAEPISVEQLAQVTRLLHASGDVRAALAKVGVSMADYVRGTEHWSRQFAGDPDLERRFHEVLRTGDPT